MKEILTFVLIILAVSAYPVDFEGKIIEVVDGNTVVIETEEKEVVKLWLDEVDAPELVQNYGTEAKAYLVKVALNRKVKVQLKGKDRWGNQFAVITLRGEKCLSTEMLKAGMVWNNGSEEKKQLQEQAMKEGKGLWKESEPTPPWIFRRERTMKEAKSS